MPPHFHLCHKIKIFQTDKGKSECTPHLLERGHNKDNDGIRRGNTTKLGLDLDNGVTIAS